MTERVWCEMEKTWCDIQTAIYWNDYVGYITPNNEWLIKNRPREITIKWYKKGKLE